MARPLRIEYPGALYHITSRGNGGQKIFRSDKDRVYFLKLLATLTDRFHWLCHAWCLMDNHYHLVIETPEGNLSRGMRQLNGMYTQKYNWKYHKTGHVFQGRYKAIIVDKDSYLLELCRYVALNPVRAHVVEEPEDFRWSSYRATAGIDKAPSFPCCGLAPCSVQPEQETGRETLQRICIKRNHTRSTLEGIKRADLPGRLSIHPEDQNISSP